MEMLFNNMDSDNPHLKPDLSMNYSIPSGQVMESFPANLVPRHHEEPTLNDPTLPKPNWDNVIGETHSDGQSEPDLLMNFAAPSGQAPEFFPADLVPHHHEEPTPNDFAPPEPNWIKVFSGDLKLTESKEGLHSQKVNRNITEIANAIRNRHEFVSISGQLAIYKSPCWKIMDHSEMLRFVKETADELFPRDAKYLSSRQYGEIVSLLQHDRGTKLLREIPTPDYRYLCCRDYMYKWSSGTCYPHNSSYQRFSCLNIDAKTIGACDGTHWEMFLDNLTGGDCVLRQRILEMIGVILSGYPSKSFFYLEGESGTGKSQLVNALRHVLGRIACVALNDVSQLGQKWTTGSLFGKLLCLCGDMPNAPLDSKTIGTIKQLTGDDLIRGEFKYKDAFMFENTAKLLFVSNYPLQIPNQNQEQALLERLVYIPCQNPVARENQIPALHKILYEEAGYIVHLAMDALRELDSRNGVFTPLPDTLSTASFRMPDCEQLVEDFVQERCVLEENASCRVSEAFQAFLSYAPEVEMNSAQFSKLLYRLYPQIQQTRCKDARKYKGLRLADLAPENPS